MKSAHRHRQCITAGQLDREKQQKETIIESICVDHYYDEKKIPGIDHGERENLCALPAYLTTRWLW